MAIDHVDRAIVARGHTSGAGQGPMRSIGRRITSVGSEASGLLRRVVALASAIIGSVIGAAVVVLQLVARAARGLVSRVAAVGQLVVARVEAIFRRMPSLPLARSSMSPPSGPLPLDDHGADPVQGPGDLPRDPA